MNKTKLSIFACSAMFFGACGDSSTSSNSEITEPSTIEESQDVIDEQEVVQCSDGTLVEDATLCPDGTTAEDKVTLYTCGDMTQVTDVSLCPTVYTCADGTQTTDKSECIQEVSSSSVASSSSSVVKQSSSSVIVASDSDPLIEYSGNTATVSQNNGCVTVEESDVIISCAGNYTFSGNGDGQIRVNAASTDNVYLFLNNLTLENSSDAAVYVQNADKALIVLNEGTTNLLSDGSTRTKSFTKNDGSLDTTNAAIYAKDDLTLKGNGSLTVTGNYNNGIQTSNDLRFRDNPNVTVTAVKNALKGKDKVDIEGGTLALTATNGDGIKSDRGEDEGAISEGKGIVIVKGGTIKITQAGDDGIQAYNYVMIADSVSNPNITINSTGHGISSDNNVYIAAGVNDITTQSDGINVSMNVYIDGGVTNIAANGSSGSSGGMGGMGGWGGSSTTTSGKSQGIHADSTLWIRNGSINVSTAEEGFEAYYIRAIGGMSAVSATDDGWNAAGGSADANSSSGSSWSGPGGMGGMSSSKGYIFIEGGYHYLYAAGNDVDVLDANGTVTMNGGVLILELGSSNGGGMGGRGSMGGSTGSCSTNNSGGIIDTDNGFTINGGVMLGFGSQTEEYPNCTATSYTSANYYGSSNAAFQPSGSGSMILYGGSVTSVSQVNVSGMKSVELPNGKYYYYN